MTAQARFVLALAVVALTLGWVGLRRGNAELEARLASAVGVRP